MLVNKFFKSKCRDCLIKKPKAIKYYKRLVSIYLSISTF